MGIRITFPSYVNVYNTDHCYQCGGKKRIGFPFCQSCFSKLPEDSRFQFALLQPELDNGETYRKAIEFIKKCS